jgi:uncharacterized protein (TIGR00251 family)
MKKDGDGVWAQSPEGITLRVRVCPSARRNKSPAIIDVGDGQKALEIGVREAPIDGKANKAVIEKIAEFLDVPKSSVVIKSGEASRLKRIFIAGDPNQLVSNIQRVIL